MGSSPWGIRRERGSVLTFFRYHRKQESGPLSPTLSPSEGERESARKKRRTDPDAQLCRSNADRQIRRDRISGQGFPAQNRPVKKFLVFTYYAGRPLGGAKDFLADFDSVEEALDNILDEPTRYYQIVNSETMRVRKQGLARFKYFDPREFRRAGVD